MEKPRWTKENKREREREGGLLARLPSRQKDGAIYEVGITAFICYVDRDQRMREEGEGANKNATSYQVVSPQPYEPRCSFVALFLGRNRVTVRPMFSSHQSKRTLLRERRDSPLPPSIPPARMFLKLDHVSASPRDRPRKIFTTACNNFHGCIHRGLQRLLASK